MSLHMKATMMKVSDPIIFGHCVKVYFKVSNHFLDHKVVIEHCLTVHTHRDKIMVEKLMYIPNNDNKITPSSD